MNATATPTPTLDVVVRRRELQGDAVVVLELAPASGDALPAFEAGAHIDLLLPGGLMRPYSLCGNPAETARWRLGVLKDPASRGGSVAVHERLAEGTRLAVSLPRNHFPLAEDAPHSVLVGGGIGITPMLAMAWRLHALGRSFELHYCVRSRGQAAFLDELADVPWADRVSLHVDGEGNATRLQPRAAAAAAPTGAQLYVCGPSGFMDWVLAEAAAAGLPPASLHREYFAAPTAPPGAVDAAFEVEARRSRKTVTVAAGQSILEALAGVGVRIPISCEQGVCGTCLCTVLDGEVDHRDAYLTDEEKHAQDQILVCCSRARGARLVLDV